MAVKKKPEGYHSVTPYLYVDGAAAAIDWYVRVLGASEIMRMPSPGGRVGHAEIRIGDSVVMLADEHPEMGAKAPKAYGGSPIGLFVYCEDVDATFARAIAAGAEATRPVEDQFYGDRMGGIRDPFGFSWYLATHVEDVPPEEMKRRMEKMGGGG
jgi:PhnB protein